MTGRQLTHVSIVPTTEGTGLDNFLTVLLAAAPQGVSVKTIDVVGFPEIRECVYNRMDDVPARRVNEAAKAMLFWLIENPNCGVEVYCTDCGLRRDAEDYDACRCQRRGHSHGDEWEYYSHYSSGLMEGHFDWVISVRSLRDLRARGLPPAGLVKGPKLRKVFGPTTRRRLITLLSSLDSL